MLISNFKRLYVGDFFHGKEATTKVILSKSSKLIVDGMIMDPFAEDLDTNFSIMISSSNHVKPLKNYINIFGFPKKNLPSYEKERQEQVLRKVKELYSDGII